MVSLIRTMSSKYILGLPLKLIIPFTCLLIFNAILTHFGRKMFLCNCRPYKESAHPLDWRSH